MSTSPSRRRLLACPSLWTLGLLALAGCGDGKSTVRGTVTLDGQPVDNGTITFVNTEGGKLIREGAVIRGGMFEATVPPGNFKIELNSQKVVGKRTQKGFDGKDETLEISEEMFPDKYNVKTELTQEIKPGSNAIKLDLKSKP